MAQHQQRHGRDAEAPQASVHECRIGTRVDHHGGVRAGPHREGITLTDVAGDHDPIRRRPPRCEDPHRQRDQRHRRDHREEHPPRRRPTT
jgi:hypothetical protein